MLPLYVDDAKVWQLLYSIDEDLAAQARADGCAHCGAPLHAAHYPRKPRGPDRALLGLCDMRRLSWCCAREGCRRRTTPASVRFLARRVYVGVWVVLVSALTHGLSARRLGTLRAQLGADERTVRLRFAIIGPLLAAPPEPGALREALQALAKRQWRHPLSGEPVQFSFATLERWYYAARKRDRDPVAALRTRRRADAGQVRRMCGFRAILNGCSDLIVIADSAHGDRRFRFDHDRFSAVVGMSDQHQLGMAYAIA